VLNGLAASHADLGVTSVDDRLAEQLAKVVERMAHEMNAQNVGNTLNALRHYHRIQSMKGETESPDVVKVMTCSGKNAAMCFKFVYLGSMLTTDATAHTGRNPTTRSDSVDSVWRPGSYLEKPHYYLEAEGKAVLRSRAEHYVIQH
jgi:hypothetical protein